MDKKKLRGIILASVFTVIFTLIIYILLKKIGGSTADFISDFGSILSAVATFFAAYVAIQLFNDWKDPHKANFYVNECKAILNLYKKLLALSRTLSILELNLLQAISLENGIERKVSYSRKESENVMQLNKSVKKNVKLIFDTIDELQTEVLMLFSLSNDNSILFESIELERALTSYFKKLLEVDSDNYFKTYDELKVANSNQYLITRGKVFIEKVKIIGNI